MAINASNYVLKADTPNAPRISVDVMSDSTDHVSSAITAYNAAADSYSSSFARIVETRDYVSDRFMKDLCVQSGIDALTKDGIDYKNNTVELHVKANELYGKASEGKSLRSEYYVNAITSAFGNYYDTFYTEEGTCVLDTDELFYESPVSYDTKAYVVGASGITADITSGTKFINDKPNAEGTSRTFTSYKGVGEPVSAYSPDYVISHVGNYAVSANVTSSVWVVKSSADSSVPVAYTTSVELNGSTVWTEI